jgi:hypothetical protein
LVGKFKILAALLATCKDVIATPLVKALSSTFYAHSSAPTTLLIWYLPSTPNYTLLSKNIATCCKIGNPFSISHCLS